MASHLVRFKRHLLPPLVAFVVAHLLAQTDLFQRFENATLDWRTRLRARWQHARPSDQLLLIGIDEASLHDRTGFGRWPWRRSVHGDLLQLVAQVEPDGPTVVGWDILFPEASPDDDDLAEGIRLSRLDVVFGAERAKAAFGATAASAAAKAARLEALPHVEGDLSRIPGSDAMLLPAGELARLAAIGFVDTPPGTDGVRREVPLLVRIGPDVYPSLSLQMLLRHWHAAPAQVRVHLGHEITIETPGGRQRIPIAADGSYFVNYRHTIDEYPVVGYRDIFDRLREHYVEGRPTRVHAVANRMLLVGQIADGLSDFGPTPFSALTPLVMVHANILENVVQHDYVRRLPPAPIWIGGLFLGVLGLAVFAERPLRHQVVFSLGVPVLYCAFATIGWIGGSWLIPLVGPLVGFGAVQGFMIATRLLNEQRSKEQIKAMFGTYVSPAFVQRLIESGRKPELGGHEDEITAYFSDIQGYSTFAEKLPPPQLVELLNDYLTVCTDTVQEKGGTLDKYIGDAVVAMFGAPIPLPDHTYRACVAALRVQDQLGALRGHWNAQAERWPEGVLNMRSRIGLNSGAAIVGNMGSRTRFNYTMTGDNVNLAARMESGAKSWGVYTMCTEATKLACEKHGAGRVVFRPLGRIRVVGRSQPVPVFEIVALKENLDASTGECLGLFAEALDRYHARDWQRALAGFRRSAALEPNQPGRDRGVKSNPSLIYLGIIEQYLARPPAEDWDGVYVMMDK